VGTAERDGKIKHEQSQKAMGPMLNIGGEGGGGEKDK
jgi:hypothetical protein